ncbi:MAG: hypothetical protein PHS65_06570 [Arcobacteraceae bacterium]|nr:hypothetical protein [Arcobacteraceae bacterium]
MFRVSILLFLFSVTVFAKNIHFLEEKYYEALDSTFKKTGNINFLKNSIEISYDGDESVLKYKDDLLVIQGTETEKVVDLTQKPVVKMFFILLKAVYFDNREIFESYFTIKKTKEFILLKPHGSVSSYIDVVRYKKINNKLEFLQINLRNKDRIRIEEIE